MNTILFLDSASDSGSLGFSEAWPLKCGQLGASRSLLTQTAYHPAHTAWTSIRSATSTMSSTLA